MNEICSSSEILIFLAIFKKVLNIIQIIAPILGIIAFIMILIQLIMHPDEKKLIKKLKNSLLALFLLFFIPLLVRVSVNLVSENTIDCLEPEELSALENYNFSNPKYIEIDDNEKTKILPNADDYEKGQKSTITPSNDLQAISEDNAIYFLNVGASTDAIIIQDSGKFGLIDTSLSSKGEFIVNQLKKLGATSLEFVMITHSHVDHTGGYEKVMSAFPVKALFTKKAGTTLPAHQGTYKRLINVAEKNNTFVCDVAQTICQNFALGNINFKLYNTDFVSAAGLSNKNRGRVDNANSIAAVATINNKRIYFSGDIGNYFGHNQESITAKEIGDIDIYKVAHHGYVSFNNNQDALNALQAEYAIVTNNRSNSNTAVKRLYKANANFIKVYYTTDGTVALHIDTDGSIKFQQ